MNNQLSELEKSWLAGFIDGEGYIGITSFDNKDEEIYRSLLLLNKKGN